MGGARGTGRDGAGGGAGVGPVSVRVGAVVEAIAGPDPVVVGEAVEVVGVGLVGVGLVAGVDGVDSSVRFPVGAVGRCLVGHPGHGCRREDVAPDPVDDEPHPGRTGQHDENPEVDLLRTAVQLMRVSAIAATSRRDVEGLETAEERINAADELIDPHQHHAESFGVDPQRSRHDRQGVQHRAERGGPPPWSGP